jgi:two-component system sensor histidine kinase ChiS
MNKLFVKLLSQLTDGIVMFDITGKVFFSNLKRLGFEGIVVDKRIADESIMREVAMIHGSKNEQVKNIKLDMVGQIENDKLAIIIQEESMFCLFIKKQSEKLKYKSLQDNMFKLINYELRTPIQNFSEGACLISDMLKVYKDEVKIKDDVHSLIKLTVDSAEEVTSKMEKLLELSETYGDDPMHNKERINLVEVIRSAIDYLSEMSTRKKIVVKFKQKGDIVGNLYGSFGWLKRAITECVQNSIEHSHYGSEIHIEIRQNSHFAHISIRDFGRGISPKVKDTLFEPFLGGGDKDEFSNQGLGIGLSLAKNIIQNHGGNIKNIKIQDGVEFHIELPTGGEKSSGNDLDIRQSQLYARDMALLLSKEASKKTNKEL